jgi:hypothetical protein
MICKGGAKEGKAVNVNKDSYQNVQKTCRRSHALYCQVTPQNKVNIGAT